MKPYYFKVEQYKNGEGYIGYFLVLADNIKKALQKLQENKNFKEVKDYGGIISTNLCDAKDMLENFSSDVFELVYDNYN